MTEFYSINAENENPQNDYQLQNLGKQTIMAVIGKSVRGDWGEERNYQSQTFYRDTTSDDYDNAFANKLLDIKPPYDLQKILDYHLDFYLTKKHGDKLKFIKQIKYVVLPIIKNRKNNDIYVELILDWINEREMKKQKGKQSAITLKVENINAPTQFQVNSDNSSQTQQVSYTENNVREFFDELKKDIEVLNAELKDDFQIEIDNALKQLNKGNNINSRLLTIGSLIKEVGINVFTNLIASPIFELMKPILGLL